MVIGKAITLNLQAIGLDACLRAARNTGMKLITATTRFRRSYPVQNQMDAIVLSVIADGMPAAVIDFDYLAFFHVDSLATHRESHLVVCHDRYMYAV